MSRFWKGVRAAAMIYVGVDMFKVLRNTWGSWKSAISKERTEAAVPWSVVVYKTIVTALALLGYVFLVYMALFL